MRGVSLTKGRVRQVVAEDARTLSFSCPAALHIEFEARAVALGCSIDWLLAEAMQRLLAETRTPVSDVAPRPAARDEVDVDLDDEELRATEEWASSRTPFATPAIIEPPPPPAPPATPEEIVLAFAGRRVRVDREPFVIGRRTDDGIDLAIDMEGISRRHAMLERGENGWLIFDLNSKNGTLVNDNFVNGAPLRAGDLISLGPVFVGVENAPPPQAVSHESTLVSSRLEPLSR